MQNQIFCIKLTLYFILSSIISLFLAPSQLHADAYGPLSKDKDLEMVKEKKWSIEAGGMVGSLNGNLATTIPFFFFLFPSSSYNTNQLLLSIIPYKQKVSGSTSAGTFLVSYKLFKRFSIDFGVMGGIMIPISKNTLNLPRIGFKYFISDGVLKPFVSLHTSSNLSSTSRGVLPLEVLTYGVGGRYEISESFYLDTSITRTSFESRFADNRFEATSIGLELRAGYLF